MNKQTRERIAAAKAKKPPVSPFSTAPMTKKQKARAAYRRTKDGKVTAYSEILADRILERFAAGEHLKDICKTDGFPPINRVLEWALYPDEENRPGFSEKFRRAEEIYHHMMASELVSIADDDSKDIVVKIVQGRPVQVVDTEHIARTKLRIDTRVKVLSKKLKSVFGEQVEHTHNINIDIASRLQSARNRVELREAKAIKMIEASPSTVEVLSESSDNVSSEPSSDSNNPKSDVINRSSDESGSFGPLPA